MARHVLTVVSAAPYSGPTTLPISCTAPTTPSGTPRRRGGHRSATSASVTGTSPPPPAPCTVRPSTMTQSVFADAVSSDPAAKASRQKARTGPRPKMSDRRPSSGSTAT